MDDLRLDRRPLYVQAHDRLLALISDEGLQPGDQLPSETLLAERLGIARATLREALRLLEDEGAIVRRHGVGTFVAADHHMESGLERLESVLDLAGRQGLQTSVRQVSVEKVSAGRVASQRLRVAPGSPLTSVTRTILVAEQPAAYMEDVVPEQWLAPGDLDDGFSGSVLDLLRNKLGAHVCEAQADITAVRAGRRMAERLGVRQGAALLLLEETLFDRAGTPLGFSRNYFVPDRFRFHVIRR